MYLPGLEDKHYRALAHLRGSQEFTIVLEGLQIAMNHHHKELANADELKDVKILQGKIRLIDTIFGTYNYAPEYVEKLKK